MKKISISNSDSFWSLIKKARRHGSAPLDSETRGHLVDQLGFELPVAIYRCSGLLRLGARAFAFDNGVYLDGRQPASPSLLFHEIAHLLQQRSGRVKNADAREIAFNFNEELEGEADQIAGALQTGASLPPWVHDGATMRNAAVVQFLRLADLNPAQTAKWNTFVKSAKAANANPAHIAAALENVTNFATLEPLFNQFKDPGLTFDGAAAVAKFVHENPKKSVTPPSTQATGNLGAGNTKSSTQSGNITNSSPKQSGNITNSSPKPSGNITNSSPTQSSTITNSSPKPSGNITNSSPTAPWGAKPKVVPSSLPPEPKEPVKITIASATDQPGALSAENAEQSWDDIVALLKQTSKPSDVLSVKANHMYSTSGETREAELMLKFSDGTTYKFVLHYHPPQPGANWLHFKNNQHATTNYKVNKWDHWAIKAAGIKETKFTAGKLL